MSQLLKKMPFQTGAAIADRRSNAARAAIRYSVTYQAQGQRISLPESNAVHKEAVRVARRNNDGNDLREGDYAYVTLRVLDDEDKEYDLKCRVEVY